MLDFTEKYKKKVSKRELKKLSPKVVGYFNKDFHTNDIVSTQ